MKRIVNYSRSLVVNAKDSKEFLVIFKRLVGSKIGGWFGKNYIVGENKIVFEGSYLQLRFLSLVEVIHSGEIDVELSAKELIKISYKLNMLSRFITLFFILLPLVIIFIYFDFFPIYFVLLYPFPYFGFVLLLCTLAYFKFDSVIDQCIRDAGGKRLD